MSRSAARQAAPPAASALPAMPKPPAPSSPLRLRRPYRLPSPRWSRWARPARWPRSPRWPRWQQTLAAATLALALPELAPAPALAAPLLPPAAEGPSSQRGAGFEITPVVRQQLKRIQEQWLQWVSAADRAHSAAAVSEMLATAEQLGMTRLPDLSLRAVAWAMAAARRN